MANPRCGADHAMGAAAPTTICRSLDSRINFIEIDGSPPSLWLAELSTHFRFGFYTAAKRAAPGGRKPKIGSGVISVEKRIQAMKNIIGRLALAMLLGAPVAVYAQTPDNPPAATVAPPQPITSVPPYTVGESPDRPVNVPPPGVTPAPGYDGISTRARDQADRIRCVPGAACETDGTFRNVDK